MTDEGQLIGFLGPKVAAPFAGQRVYVLEDGRYALGDGKTVNRAVMQQLLLRGLLLSPEASMVTVIDDMTPFVPEKIDPLSMDGVVYIKDRDRAVARISYYAEKPYEGELLFRSNLESHFVSERGYVLNLKTLQELGEAGFLLVPKATKPRDPFTLQIPAAGTMAISESERFARRQHFAKLGFLFVALVLLSGVAYFFSLGLAKTSNNATKSLSSIPSPGQLVPSTPSTGSGDISGAQKELGGAISDKNKKAGDMLGGTTPTVTPNTTPTEQP